MQPDGSVILNTTKVRKKYTCYVCFVKFATAAELDKHKTEHEFESEDEDPLDNLPLTSIVQVSPHSTLQKQQHNEAQPKSSSVVTNYKCLRCKKVFVTSTDIRHHYYNNCTFSCSLCENKTFNNKGGFMMHVIQHELYKNQLEEIRENLKEKYLQGKVNKEGDKQTNEMQSNVQGEQQTFQKTKRMTCDQCFDVCESETEFNKHMQLHKVIDEQKANLELKDEPIEGIGVDDDDNIQKTTNDTNKLWTVVNPDDTQSSKSDVLTLDFHNSLDISGPKNTSSQVEIHKTSEVATISSNLSDLSNKLWTNVNPDDNQSSKADDLTLDFHNSLDISGPKNTSSQVETHKTSEVATISSNLSDLSNKLWTNVNPDDNQSSKADVLTLDFHNSLDVSGPKNTSSQVEIHKTSEVATISSNLSDVTNSISVIYITPQNNQQMIQVVPFETLSATSQNNTQGLYKINTQPARIQVSRNIENDHKVITVQKPNLSQTCKDDNSNKAVFGPEVSHKAPVPSQLAFENEFMKFMEGPPIPDKVRESEKTKPAKETSVVVIDSDSSDSSTTIILEPPPENEKPKISVKKLSDLLEKKEDPNPQDELPMTCNKCKTKFYTLEAFVQHKHYKCKHNQCNYESCRVESMRYHYIIRHRLFYCGICQYLGATLNDRKEHVMKEHKCKYCHVIPNDLEAHMMQKHPSYSGIVMKEHKCKYCDVIPNDLEAHMMQHKCKYCDVITKDLEAHLMQHKCKYCRVMRSDLEAHVMLKHPLYSSINTNVSIPFCYVKTTAPTSVQENDRVLPTTSQDNTNYQNIFDI